MFLTEQIGRFSISGSLAHWNTFDLCQNILIIIFADEQTFCLHLMGTFHVGSQVLPCIINKFLLEVLKSPAVMLCNS